MKKDKELWADLKGYEGLYKVSSHGNILGVKRNKTLKLTTVRGKKYVGLCKDGVQTSLVASRIIYKTFKGEINGMIDFVDGDPSNLHIENLVDVNRTKKFSKVFCLKVIDLESNIIYDSIADLARIKGVPVSSIHRSMKSKNGKFSKYKTI